MESRLDIINKQIALTEAEFKNALDACKSFFAKKDILNRLNLLMNQAEAIHTGVFPNQKVYLNDQRRDVA